MKILAEEEKCLGWNNSKEDDVTQIMEALDGGQMDIVKILLGCPQVDLSCKDKEGWSLLFKAIREKELGE